MDKGKEQDLTLYVLSFVFLGCRIINKNIQILFEYDSPSIIFQGEQK